MLFIFSCDLNYMSFCLIILVCIGWIILCDSRRFRTGIYAAHLIPEAMSLHVLVNTARRKAILEDLLKGRSNFTAI